MAGQTSRASPSPARPSGPTSRMSSSVYCGFTSKVTAASAIVAAATPIGNRLRFEVLVRSGRNPVASATRASVAVILAKRSAGPSNGVQSSESAVQAASNSAARKGGESKIERMERPDPSSGVSVAAASSSAAPIGSST